MPRKILQRGISALKFPSKGEMNERYTLLFLMS